MRDRKILLAISNSNHRDLIIDALNVNDAKEEILLLKDGLEVLEYFQQVNTDNEALSRIAMVVLDIDLPKVGGLVILRYHKAYLRLSSIPVVIFSTSNDNKTVSEAYENGADGFITKPASLKEFVNFRKLLKEYQSKY